MHLRLLLGLVACFVMAGCGESQPVSLPPAARQPTAANEKIEPALPEPAAEPAAVSKPALEASANEVTRPAEKTVPTGKATTVEAFPPASTPAPSTAAAPNSGHALGNAVRRAFGIPLPGTGPSGPAGSKANLENTSPQPPADSSKP